MSAPDDIFGQRHAETFPSTAAPDLPKESMPPIPPALLADHEAELDREIAAMTTVALALDHLDDDARNRVLSYACQRFGSLHGTGDEPRTFWLDDLPATGDLIEVDGQKVPVTYVRASIVDGVLDWGMTTGMVEPEAVEGSGA
jgi:hypothetical protein